MLNIGHCVTTLEGFYGPLPAPPRDPFIFYVWAVLSHKTTPRKADRALAALKRLPALTPDAMHRAPQARLEAAVKLARPYLESRIDGLHAGSALFRRRPTLGATLQGPLPAARRALKPFPSLGDDGARRMLLFTTKHVVMPVDGGVRRVASRLGWVAAGSPPSSVRRSLTSALPETAPAFRRAFLFLSHHGGATCTEVEPHCVVCPLHADCPSATIRRGD